MSPLVGDDDDDDDDAIAMLSLLSLLCMGCRTNAFVAKIVDRMSIASSRTSDTRNSSPSMGRTDANHWAKETFTTRRCLRLGENLSKYQKQ
jgi:hypothetical protein